ncbi:hypothetical protein [Roseateles oligotrophus]|uniref:Uncharacterized protein n=1 Tax=Roseateles oligotrophus TaxID=1769250 RepID=A0ABT2Y933_9BURK|nr:hypothetical protein [Roseateles oligotrophus]MCV2366574.1 hypothetical protein [Roseateles oligotrophus]
MVSKTANDSLPLHQSSAEGTRVLQIRPTEISFPIGSLPLRIAMVVVGEAHRRSPLDESECVSELGKVVRLGSEDWTDSLTLRDQENLLRAWQMAKLDPLSLPIGSDAFEPYRRAFKEFGPPPPEDFELEVGYSTFGSTNYRRLLEIETEYAAYLGRCIDDGMVRPRGAESGVPIARPSRPTDVLTLEDLEKFVIRLGINVSRDDTAEIAHWRSLPTADGRQKALLDAFVALKGEFDSKGDLVRGNALSALCKADGRTRTTVRNQLRQAWKKFNKRGPASWHP